MLVEFSHVVDAYAIHGVPQSRKLLFGEIAELRTLGRKVVDKFIEGVILPIEQVGLDDRRLAEVRAGELVGRRAVLGADIPEAKAA